MDGILVKLDGILVSIRTMDGILVKWNGWNSRIRIKTKTGMIENVKTKTATTKKTARNLKVLLCSGLDISTCTQE